MGGCLLWETVQYALSESKQDGESFSVGEAWCGVRRGPRRWKAHREVFESKRSKGTGMCGVAWPRVSKPEKYKKGVHLEDTGVGPSMGSQSLNRVWRTSTL